MSQFDGKKFKRIGECCQCGDCCRPETLPKRTAAYRAAGSEYVIRNVDCDKFDDVSGKCKDYEHRPAICRDFPWCPTDVVALPRCSYSFVPINEEKEKF